MGAGGSHEIPYALPGSLPAGVYHLFTLGYQRTNDAVLHSELLYRRTGSPDQLLAAGDGPVMNDPTSGNPGYRDQPLTVAAVAARCGDLLVSRVTWVSGTSQFDAFENALQIP